MDAARTTETRRVGGGDGGYGLPAPVGRAVMRQRWRDLLFLHWEVDPGVIAATLPAGLGVDTFRGKAYLGVVPFLMEGVRPAGLPAVPGLSNFGELNLRTYVVGPGPEGQIVSGNAGGGLSGGGNVSGGGGVPGVWFYSLDAHQRNAVWLARRFFALAYHYAAIRQDESPGPGGGRRLAYRWSRGGSAEAAAAPSFVYDAPAESAARPAAPGTLEHFLVERYLLYSRRPLFVPGPDRTAVPGGGRLYAGRVDHPPYCLATPAVQRFDTQLFALNGFARPAEGVGPVSALWSPGVDVRVHPLRRVK